jgi:hypothetical protein
MPFPVRVTGVRCSPWKGIAAVPQANARSAEKLKILSVD